MTPQHGQCFACDEFVGEESYCHGCHTFICGNCAVNYSLIGGHDADEHLTPDDEDIFEGDDE